MKKNPKTNNFIVIISKEEHLCLPLFCIAEDFTVQRIKWM